MRPRLACPGWDAARSEVERCIADPGPPQARTVPGLQRTAVRCAAPGTREREGPTCGCKKMARRRGPCFRPVIYRELCNCSAWRGYANRNPVRTISAVPALPPLRGVGRDERAGGNLRVSKWESISHFYRNLQAAVRRTCGASPAGRIASKTRVDALTTRGSIPLRQILRKGMDCTATRAGPSCAP
jgi:hypothetical protein